MSRTISRLGISLVSGALVSFAMFGCSSDKSPATTNPDGGSGGKSTGGASAGGGGAGGGTATGGGGAGGAAGGATGSTEGGADPYTCDALPKRDPGGTGVEHDPCCGTSAGKVGECVQPANASGDAALKAALGHDSCGPTLVCQPTASAMSDAGKFGAYDPCRATLGGGANLEGRCLPKCFVLGNPQVALLKNDGCGGDAGAADLVCAPCFNPIDGTATGACTQTVNGVPDAPAEAAPAPYKECGGVGDSGVAGGLCVPTAVAQASGNSQVSKLKQHECAANEVCVPKVKAADVNSCFAKCTTSGQIAQIEPDTRGACVPTFVAYDAQPAASAILLPVAGLCQPGEVCAPCTDPIAMGASGACE